VVRRGCCESGAVGPAVLDIDSGDHRRNHAEPSENHDRGLVAVPERLGQIASGLDPYQYRR
jgi:hypothetical protein